MAKYDKNGKLVPDKTIILDNGLIINQLFVTEPQNNPNKLSIPYKRDINSIIGTTTHNTND